MKIEFHKYEGTGNDFVIIDNRDKKLKTNNHALWKKLCDRHFGIGADGLMLLQNKKGYDFDMVYFNADGNESSMCGNGGRCITHLAKKLGIIKGKSARFIAIDGRHEATFVNKDTIKLKMKDVDGISDHKSFYTLDTGSPHYVTLVKKVLAIPVKIDGRTIRNRGPFKKEGVNVNFVEVFPNHIPLLRTYERGVEDETLSCGTGTVAAALVLASKGLATATNHCDIQTMGGKLKVWFTQNGNSFSEVWLEGPVKNVFNGAVEV
jgi:diaminopimelate epimerase